MSKFIGNLILSIILFLLTLPHPWDIFQWCLHKLFLLGIIVCAWQAFISLFEKPEKEEQDPGDASKSVS